MKPKKRKVKGGVRRRKAGRKPASADKAIEVAQQVKGDFLTPEETADVIKDFEKGNRIKKKKRGPKKRKNRPVGRQRPATSPIAGLGIGAPAADPRSKKPKKRGKKKRRRLGGRRRR